MGVKTPRKECFNLPATSMSRWCNMATVQNYHCKVTLVKGRNSFSAIPNLMLMKALHHEDFTILNHLGDR